ncbi:hypothetical protein EC890511_2210, partial [Escherichia coli 89.0511]
MVDRNIKTFDKL